VENQMRRGGESCAGGELKWGARLITTSDGELMTTVATNGVKSNQLEWGSEQVTLACGLYQEARTLRVSAQQSWLWPGAEWNGQDPA
jgi:hypothetical protein